MKQTLSYSQIKTWKRCRHKWFYSYDEGLKPKERVRKIDLGKYGHALLEAHYRGEDLKEASQNYWEQETKDMFQEEMVEFEGVRQEAEQLVERYLKHYGEDHLKIHAVEEHFITPIRTNTGHKSMSSLQ